MNVGADGAGLSSAIQTIDEEETETPGRDKGLPEVTAEQKQDVRKLHVNLGHPHRGEFLKALRIARARPEVLQWAKRECAS